MSGAFQLAAFMVFDSFSYMYVEMEFGAKKIKKIINNNSSIENVFHENCPFHT